MESKINLEMVEEFNRIMETRGSIIRLSFSESGIVQIKLLHDNYIQEVTPVLKKDFYIDLEDFFRSRGVEKLGYNNIASCFWSF